MHIPHCSFALLVVILIACILVRYCHHHHLIASDKLMVHHVIHLPLWSTHHHHLPSLVLLLVCRVANVVRIGLLCCLCHGEVLPLPITLCKWWSSFAIGNKTKKKCFHLFFFFIFSIFLFVFFFSCFFPKKVNFWVVYNIHCWNTNVVDNIKFNFKIFMIIWRFWTFMACILFGKKSISKT